jgi:hypothetical protein
MREIRLSGSEGGGTEFNRFSLPLLRKGSAFPVRRTPFLLIRAAHNGEQKIQMRHLSTISSPEADAGAPHSEIRCARTINLLGAGPTK